MEYSREQTYLVQNILKSFLAQSANPSDSNLVFSASSSAENIQEWDLLRLSLRAQYQIQTDDTYLSKDQKYLM